MGYVFDFKDARRYENWLLKKRHRLVVELECRLMMDLLQPRAGESVIDIGCGTGASIVPLLAKGMDVTGVDPSPYMLDIAAGRLGQNVELYRAVAEDLPFDDNSFNHACFFTSLEFVEDPCKALEEACRVAKDRVFIGFLNRYALEGIKRRLVGIFTDSIFNRARFFSVWELKKLARSLLGPVPIQWRTVCQFPNPAGRFMSAFERNRLVQHCPFGAFGGMVITLVPRFRTRPLAIGYNAKQSTGAVAG